MISSLSLPLTLTIVAVALLALSIVVVVQFLRLTAGESGLRARLARLFRRPVVVRPVPEDHYYHRYWQRDSSPRS